jgi:TfoX/Sxy family transcriptional regulator of competence genes
MSNAPATIAFVQQRLPPPRFTLKPMFGEHALYADGKVVALVCDDRVFVKVHDTTKDLADCELAPPYPGAKDHYVVEEGLLTDPAFAKMLVALAKALPAPKAKGVAGKKAETKKRR